MRSWFLNNLQSSLFISAIALVLLCSFPLINRSFKSKIHYYLWIVVLLFLVNPIHPKIRALEIPNSIAPVQTQMWSERLEEDKSITPIAGAEGTVNHIPSGPSERNNIVEIFTKTVPYIWLCGGLLILLHGGLRYKMLLKKIKRTQRQTDNPEITRQFELLKAEMGVASKVTLVICPIVLTPMSVGIRNPFIVLPCDTYEEETINYILKHELIHCKRKDQLVKWLSLFTIAVNWFNPLVYIFCKLTGHLCELSCDSEVVADCSLTERYVYGSLLIDRKSHQDKIITLVSNFQNGKLIRHRIKHIMDTTTRKNGALLIVLLVFVCTGMSILYVKAADYEKPLFPQSSDLPITAEKDDYIFELDATVTEGPWVYSRRYASHSYSTKEYLDMMKVYQNKATYQLLGKTIADDTGAEVVWTEDILRQALLKFQSDLSQIEHGEQISDMVFKGVHLINIRNISSQIILNDGQTDFVFGASSTNVLEEIKLTLQNHPLYNQLNFELVKKMS
jgi:Antirepressor regulating drug resistance, predicted signal transduction N-terminal membrane component